MKPRVRIAPAPLAILLAVVLGAGYASAQNSPEKLATTVVDRVLAGQHAEVAATFTPEMARALPTDALKQTWQGFIGQAGALRRRGTPRIATQGDVTLVVVPLQFERAAVEMRVSVSGDKVAGLFIVPVSAEAASPSVTAWTDAAYVDHSAFTETDVQIGEGRASLPGTLSLPRSAKKVAAAVLVHGSGPNDRDETIGPNRPFRDLAGGLASRGIAVLRYDKRTRVHPEKFAASQRFTVREEVIDDALAAVALLRARPQIDPGRIVIVGHSLGGMLAPRIAQQDPRLAGLVLLAGAARPLYDILIEQSEYLAGLSGAPAEALAAVRADAERARHARPDDGGPPIFNAPPAYWADINAYDPARAAATLALPMLILQGGRDYQVTSRDLERFRAMLAGRSDVTIHEFPRLNHLFMTGEGKSRPEEYQRLGHIEGEVIESVAGFIGSLAAK